MLCSDGLHLSPAGQEFVGAELIRLIARKWPELRVVPCPSTGSTSSAGSCSPLQIELPTHDRLDSRADHLPIFEPLAQTAAKPASTRAINAHAADARAAELAAAVVLGLAAGFALARWRA